MTRASAVHLTPSPRKMMKFDDRAKIVKIRGKIMKFDDLARARVGHQNIEKNENHQKWF